ncbi:MAG: glycosyltransferase family 4 protein [Gammaproteobacteria bacterium]|nr:glycosyltransferase family 4 protein [Gammaproteobacteria bacterium]MDH3769146.1 glycosyltransferase family 4 protein [Gammaproteobacteria bacterium]
MNADAAVRRKVTAGETGPLRLLLISNHRRFKISFRAQPWARELAARGHDVDVMCHAQTERLCTRIEHVDGFRLIENPDLLIGSLRQGWDPVCALRRGRFLFREDRRYDLIHCLDTRLAVIWPALTYARRRGIPIVSDWIDWWGRGGLIKERRPLWYRAAFAGVETFFEEHYRNKLDGLTAVSHALIERAITLGVPRERCKWIPGGANFAAFDPICTKKDIRGRLGIAMDQPVLCFAGLDVLVDLPLAFAAFERVHAVRKNALLLLVGVREADIRQIDVGESARRAIRVLGRVPYAELADHLAAADVFLMPYPDTVSNRGRWPNKIGDYMCVGRPTVSNPVGEVQRLFTEHEVGVLAEPEPDAMAEAVLTLIANPEQAAAIGRRAREIAESYFRWDRLVAGLESWYREILRKSA